MSEVAVTLDRLMPGQTGTVVRVVGKGRIRRRIMDMGVTRGVTIEMLRAAPMGDPIEYRVRGYNLSLRRTEAQMIEVELPVTTACRAECCRGGRMRWRRRWRLRRR